MKQTVPLRLVEAYVPLARELGVSRVARSAVGFLSAYRRAGGNLTLMPGAWLRKREGFIARHEAQRKARGEPLWTSDGYPTRRHLALLMWAYSPSPAAVLRIRAPR